MKNKSSHHQSENTFKFQTFGERLANINIDAVRRLKRFTSTPQESDTFFGEALAKWTELNCTQYFVNFRLEISHEVQSFAQLVHHQDSIVNVLERHLRVPGNLALQPLLDLVVQLARDLQGDFYPYFDRFFAAVVALLHKCHHHVDLLEQAFTCLAYLFKFLWRLMVKDIERVYTLFCPLLSSKYQEYINTFAAESFAFLMRKVKDESDLFDYMFTTLEETPDQTTGVGCLLFEMVKGVQEQFHSSIEQVLPVLLSKLGSVSLSYDLVLEALRHMWNLMADHTTPQHALCVWRPLLSCIEATHQKWQGSNVKSRSEVRMHLIGLLQLAQVWVSYKDGVLMTDSADIVVKVLLKVLKGEAMNTSSVVFDIVASLLLATRCPLASQHRPSLINAVFSSRYSGQELLKFTRRLFALSLFEKDLLPAVLRYCHDCMLKTGGATRRDDSSTKEMLYLLLALLQHKMPAVDQTPAGYPLDFTPMISGGPASTRKSSKSFPAWVVSEVDRLSSDVSDLDTLWALLHCLPQLRPLDADQTLVSLTKVFSQLQMKLGDVQSCCAPSMTKLNLCVLFECLSALHQLQDPVTFYKTVSLKFIISLVRRWPASVPSLRIAHLYIGNITGVTRNDLLTEDTFKQLFEPMQENLSSPYSQVRLLTLLIFCEFTLPMPRLDDAQVISQPGVFRICLEAERVPLSVQTSRDKLLHLRKLDVHVVVNQVPIGPYSQVALRYLLGMLHVNFKMLWQPVMELIKSHADHMTRQDFWDVFKKQLETAADLSEKSLMQPKLQMRRQSVVNTSQTEDTPDDQMTFDLAELFNHHQVALVNQTEHPDYANVRQLLWQTMLLFPGVCEAKTRIISPLLFRFIDNEYRPTDISVTQMQDVRRSQGDTVDLDLNSSQDGGGVTEPTDQLDESAGGTERRRASNKTLVVHLTLFCKFKQPRSVYLEPRLTTLYYDLLQHPDGLVQKVAFDCIMTYGHKYLTPYSENFERLLDDKSFKNELVMFSIAEENSVILSEHRAGLIPVLMRMLYGKMQAKSGKDTSGHKHVQMRKNMILRFLAGSQSGEVKVFLDLVFHPFLHLVSDDVNAKVNELTDNVDLSQIIPIKKQQGVVSTIEVVLKKLGSLIESYLPNILQILVCLAGLCTRILEQRHLVATGVVNSLKSLRAAFMTRINQFFQSFLTYPYCASEVDAIFTALVWPQVTKLSYEGVYSPTSLLKIFVTWSAEPRYLPLLAKVKSAATEVCEVSPLPFIFELLLAKSVSVAVIDAIMTLVENLLVTDDFKVTDSDKAIDTGVTISVDKQVRDTSYGTALLLPHIPAILRHLKGVVTAMAAPSMGRRKTIPARELNILARLSEFVRDDTQSADLVRLLLPFLGRRLSRSLAVEVDVLTAVKHLIGQVKAPAEFIQTIANLFSTLSARTSRTHLCEVLKSIASKEPSMEVTAEVITKLNAWDARRVDEPDYLQRLEAFHQIRSLLAQKNSPDVTLLLMLVHNCVFFIATTDDLSLRDSSTDCLKEVLTRLGAGSDDSTAQQRALFQTVILQNLLPEVKRNLKLKSEVARNEFITILAHLVRKFPKCEIFSDLLLLIDDADPEVDFFNNVTHIQPHRRGRALRRVAKHLAVTRMKRDTLVSYLLPIVTAFLRDDAAVKHHNLVDAAVDAVGVICHCLPWPRYLLILQYYLNQLPRSLDNQKVMVKIVVSVLDSFNFDLQHSQGVYPTANKKKSAELVKEVVTVPAERDPHKVGTGGGKRESVEQPLVNEGGEEEMLKDLGEEEEEEGGGVDVLPPGGVVVCSEGMATRIHRVIIKSILPLLHKCLTHKTKSDDEHKMAKTSKYAEDEEILRVPIALAMVKLLQSLPKSTLQRNLPGILLKVCHFLQSRAQDIRDTSRDTLIKIVQSLGPSYFSFVLKELRAALLRGYQRHILSYTVWSLLRNMSGQLKPGDLDPCISSLTEVFNEELFGEVGEEKEVQGIVSKLMEARSSKSYESYRLLARLVSKTSLAQLITPLKQVLESTHSHKKTKKVSDALNQIGQGLVDNDGLVVDTVLTFVYALTKEVLPGLQVAVKEADTKEAKPKTRRPPSQLLLTPEPPRGGKKPKTHVKTNVSIIIEFGLQLLFLLLKKGQVGGVKVEHLQLLDPFIATLTVCIESKHVKVATASMRCLGWLLKFSLPALKKHITQITAHLFVLLSNYAAAGAAKGENFELVVMCFKTMTVLVRDIKYHSISTEQLQVLLGYVEQDIHDYTRQATAFSLLKAILSRKLVVAEIEDVLGKVEQLSITAESAHVRLQCRQVEMQFLLDYPLGKKLQRHLEFYVAQLNYEHEAGRESALEMLAMIFAAFPLTLLSEYAGFFFIPLVSRLTSDESAKCRRLTALAVKCLLGKLDSDQRDQLFDMCVQWLQGSKVSLNRVAALTCGLFVEVESGGFERHLATLLPLIEEVMEPEKYDVSQDTSVVEDRQLDLLLFNVITLLIKLCRECDIVRRPRWTLTLNNIWGYLETHLLHPHAWVRLVSAQMFGILFGAWSVDEVITSSSRQQSTEAKETPYIETDIDSWVYTLCGTFCKQLTSAQLDTELAEQIIKNTVFLAKLLKRMPRTGENDDITKSDGNVCTHSDGVVEPEKRASLNWLIKRMCREAQQEAALNPKATIKRKSVFTWLAALAVDLGETDLSSYLPLMMPPLVREFTNASSKEDSELHSLSQQVLDLLKGIVGVQTFTQTYATALRALTERRDIRKRQRATQAVSDPALAARRKIKKNLAKKEAKKRRIEELRPTKTSSSKKRKRKA